MDYWTSRFSIIREEVSEMTDLTLLETALAFSKKLPATIRHELELLVTEALYEAEQETDHEDY